MVSAAFIVVVDANLLFPLTLRDTVLRAADFYQLRWSKEILDEMQRNLVSTMTMSSPESRAPHEHTRRYPGGTSRGAATGRLRNNTVWTGSPSRTRVPHTKISRSGLSVLPS